MRKKTMNPGAEQIEFENARSYNDAVLIHQWRNDPRTTRYWINKRVFPIDEHLNWFEKNLNNPNEIMLFPILDSQRIGLIRLSKGKDCDITYAEVGIYLDPNLHGRGYGLKILLSLPDWIKKNEPEIEVLIARVGKNNLASNKTFSHAGFSCLPIEITETMKLKLILPDILQLLNTGSNVTDNLISEENSEFTHYIYIMTLACFNFNRFL